MSTKLKKSSRNNQQVDSIDATLDSFWNKYSNQNSQRVKMIDFFIIYLIMVIATQFFYKTIVGDDFPKNAFISGTFCPLGIIILLVSLRKNQDKGYRVLGQFFLASLVLFIVSINFAG